MPPALKITNVAFGRGIAQAVSHRPYISETWVRELVSSCGICGGQSDTGKGFSQSSLVFPCQHHSTVALHTHRHISSGG
jgi:hypothetical protein